MYSVLNTISEYTYFYISKTITSCTCLLVFRIVESLQNIFKYTNGFVVREDINEFSLIGTYYKLDLGVIDDIHPNNIVVVSYLLRANTKGKT